MKEFRFRLILIIFAIGLSIFLIYPTYQDYQHTKDLKKTLSEEKSLLQKSQPQLNEGLLEKKLIAMEDSIKATESFRAAREKRMKLGLDLQGGMRVVLEVNTAKLIEKLAQNQDDAFLEVIAAVKAEAAITQDHVVDILAKELTERGIRLSRYFGNIREDDATITANLYEETEKAVIRAMEIIRNRVDQYGVSEPSITQQGDRRIIVELPGVAREEEARQLLQGTALLEFKLLKEPDFAVNVMQQIDKVIAGKIFNDTVAVANNQTVTDTAAQKDTAKDRQLSEEEFKREHPFFALAWLDPQGQSADAFVREDHKVTLERIFKRPDVQRVIPDNVEFLFSAKPVTFQDGQAVYQMYLVNKTPELTGNVVTDAIATLDPTTSSPMVSMEMSSEGATEWARITGANINKRCAIILDNVVFSAPVIRGKISGGRSQIEGMADLEEAKLLEIVLKAGALPAPVDIIEERSVGPSLGQDSVMQGLNSTIVSFILVSIFMIFYYQRIGAIATFGLVSTVLMILGILAGFQATLTLPGIAGIVLTIGMAVDANVLVNERIREEFELGKTLRSAIDTGYTKAFSAILDSNLTTLFTGIILYQFGTGPIQGFALTLMIGICASMFSALVISRVIAEIFVYKGYKLSLG